MLRGDVRKEHRICVRLVTFPLRAPHGGQTPREMSAVEVIGGVKFLSGLLFVLQAWIKLELVHPPRSTQGTAVDISGGIKSKPARFIDHTREMAVFEDDV